MIVELSLDDLSSAIVTGWERFRLNRERNVQHKYGAPNSIRPDVIGGIGEYAFAKFLGVDWSIGAVGTPDVDGRFEVRTTEYAHGCLILHPSDNDERVYVLAIVCDDGRSCDLRGWIRGRDGKKPSYWREGERPAFFVPQKELREVKQKPRTT